MPTYHRMAVKLSDKEVAKLGRELADKRLQHTKLKAEKAEGLQQFNAELKTLDAEIETLAHSVQEHVRYEEVEAELVPDDKRLMMEIYSVKTKQRIDVRQMTDDEKEAAQKRNKNPELPFDKGVNGGKAKSGDVKVGPRDATPAPDRVKHNGQELQKLDRSKKKATPAKGKGKAKRSEARA